MSLLSVRADESPAGNSAMELAQALCNKTTADPMMFACFLALTLFTQSVAVCRNLR